MGTKTGKEIVNTLLENIPVGEETLIEVSKDLLGKENKLMFSVQNRKLQPEQPVIPEKMESPKRSHIFHDAEGFASYISKYKSDDTIIFMNVIERSAVAVLDDKAKKGFECLVLLPMRHPQFAPWDDLIEGEELTLKDFADFLAVNRKSISQPNSKELIQILSQVRVSKEIVLQSGFGKRCMNGITCKIEILGEKKDELIDLPDSIMVKTPLFLNSKPLEFEVDLTISTNDEHEIMVRCSSGDLLSGTLAAFDEMMAIVRKIDGVTVVLGEKQHKNWDYVR